jgi:hypothetical protein
LSFFNLLTWLYSKIQFSGTPDLGEQLVGSKIKVWWPMDKRWELNIWLLVSIFFFFLKKIVRWPEFLSLFLSCLAGCLVLACLQSPILIELVTFCTLMSQIDFYKFYVHSGDWSYLMLSIRSLNRLLKVGWENFIHHHHLVCFCLKIRLEMIMQGLITAWIIVWK